MSNVIRRELQIPQMPQEVWHAITDREMLAEWMFPNDFKPRLGHRFTFQVPPNPKVNFDGLTVDCEVLELDPPKRLAFSWSAAALVDTRVSFQLEPEGEGTRLIFEHAGFDLSQPWSQQAFKGAEYGWVNMLKQLVATVARQAAGQS